MKWILGKRLESTARSKASGDISIRNNKNNLLASQMTGCQVLAMDITSESVRDIVNQKPDLIIHGAATKWTWLRSNPWKQLM